MPLYMTLAKLAADGARNIKRQPQLLTEGGVAAETRGVKTHGFYMLMGDYGFAWISEAPSPTVAAEVLLGWASEGNVTTRTLNAFSRHEFFETVADLT